MTSVETIKADSAEEFRNPYLEGNFAPVEVETTAFDLPVTGDIPEELTGRFLRIGPNPVEPVDPLRYHWFIGTGMVHGLRLRGGKAEWYRNRYVMGDSAARALGRPPIPGPRNGFGDGNANTNVIDMGGRTYAIVEAGNLPVELTWNLESVARSDLGGLKHGFSAHPKIEPSTGLLHTLCYQPGVPTLDYVTVDRDGRATTVAEVPAPHFPMIHDVAFTGRYAIVLDLPVTFQMALIAQGGFPFAWDPEMTPRVGLLPRSGDLGAMRWVEAPSCYVFHVMNAYDDGEDVVIDVVRHPKMFAKEMRGPSEGRPILARWRINATGKLSETILHDQGQEFPRFNDDRAGQSYRFGYTLGAGDALRQFDTFYKHDVVAGRTEARPMGPGRQGLEPVFVPRQGATAEDDGWIMAYVYDGERNASDVVILNAQDFTGEPVATIHLPVRAPFGFHGNWIADPQ